MRDTPLPAVFTVREFAVWSRLSRTKVYALMKSGELRFIKVGSRRLIRGDDAQAWLDAVTEAFRIEFDKIDPTPQTSLHT